MRYAISYISSANPDLSREEITILFEKTVQINNIQDINGILIYSEGKFFQFLEGEEEKIFKLYSRIVEDHRHNNISKFIGESIFRPSNDGYICEFKTNYSKYNESQIEGFLTCLQVLKQSSRQAAEAVMEKFLR